jgi:uncharacterized protein (DUF433 family)
MAAIRRLAAMQGTRIAVGDVLSYLASGMSEQPILADFPQLMSDDIRACLGFAAAPHGEHSRRLSSRCCCSTRILRNGWSRNSQIFRPHARWPARNRLERQVLSGEMGSGYWH